MMNKTPRSGKAPCGKMQKPDSYQNIELVTGAELQVVFPIIRTTKFTGNQSTLTYEALCPTVMYATAAHTQEDFNALFAGNFGQNKRVNDAIFALLRTLNEELLTLTKTGTNPGAFETEKHTPKRIRRRKSLTQ